MPSASPDGTYQIVVQLAAKRPLLSCFDAMLTTILRVLGEPQTKYRTKAMKSLTSIVEADPAILGESHVRAAVQARLWDTSVSVREATTDLIGRYILYK